LPKQAAQNEKTLGFLHKGSRCKRNCQSTKARFAKDSPEARPKALSKKATGGRFVHGVPWKRCAVGKPAFFENGQSSKEELTKGACDGEEFVLY